VGNLQGDPRLAKQDNKRRITSRKPPEGKSQLCEGKLKKKTIPERDKTTVSDSEGSYERTRVYGIKPEEM